jgi:hypothetical protein
MFLDTENFERAMEIIQDVQRDGRERFGLHGSDCGPGGLEHGWRETKADLDELYRSEGSKASRQSKSYWRNIL